jgi:cytochrome c oxidase cbb3-type subunit I/II
LFHDNIDIASTEAKINAMRTLGVPYEDGYEKIAVKDLQTQAKEITTVLMQDDDVKKLIKTEGIDNIEQKDIIALIAYLQRLGTDIHKQPLTVK